MSTKHTYKLKSQYREDGKSYYNLVSDTGEDKTVSELQMCYLVGAGRVHDVDGYFYDDRVILTGNGMKSSNTMPNHSKQLYNNNTIIKNEVTNNASNKTKFNDINKDIFNNIIQLIEKEISTNNMQISNKLIHSNGYKNYLLILDLIQKERANYDIKTKIIIDNSTDSYIVSITTRIVNAHAFKDITPDNKIYNKLNKEAINDLVEFVKSSLKDVRKQLPKILMYM